jgi:hypothetical protein
MYEETKNYCESCAPCQKFSLVRPAYKFDGKSSISGIFSEWGCDFLGPFPVSVNENRYICCFIEKATGFPFAKAVRDETLVTSCMVLKDLVSFF